MDVTNLVAVRFRDGDHLDLNDGTSSLRVDQARAPDSYMHAAPWVMSKLTPTDTEFNAAESVRLDGDAGPAGDDLLDLRRDVSHSTSLRSSCP